LLENIGLLALAQRRMPAAESNLLRAKDVYLRSVGTDSALTATCLAHLATVYLDEKRIREAEPLFRKSIDILQKTAGDDAPILAPVLREYARLLRLTGRMGEVARLEARATALEATNSKVQTARHP
jgi:hypothetical protein